MVKSVPSLKGVEGCVFAPNNVAEFVLLLLKSPLFSDEEDVLFTVVAVRTIELFETDTGFLLDAEDALGDVCIVFTVVD